MTFPGSSGNNYTGASLGGFEYSDSSYLVAGNYDADNHPEMYLSPLFQNPEEHLLCGIFPTMQALLTAPLHRIL